MNSVRSIFSIGFQNIRKWKNDYRIWTIAFLLFVMLKIYMDDLSSMCSELHEPMPVWIFPFISQQYYMKVIFTIPLVLLFCNAPFIDDNQVYIYVRSGRIRWIIGQIVYIFIASTIYYLYLFVLCMIIVLLNGGEPFDEWGSVLKTVAETSLLGISPHPFIQVSDMVIHCFRPFQACCFTFLMSWSNAVMIGVIMFTLNYLCRQKYIGTIVASFLIVLSFFADKGSFNSKLYYVSPVSWITLDKIDVGSMTTYPSFTYCILFYWIVIFIMIFATFFLGKKQEFDIRR